ncbi:MAG: HDOD domain-containing protein [Gammaproteobacteria bacterium]
MTDQTMTIDPETFLKSEYVLPPLPAIVFDIKEMIEEDRADMAEIARLVSADPGLVVQVLKIVNSAYYALPRPVTDLKYAVAFLGLAEIYRIVLTLSVVATLEVKEEEALEQFWRDAYFTALTGKFLATRMEPELQTEELWSSTLLHDVGRLLYVKFFPVEYREIEDYCRLHGCLSEEAEQTLQLPSRATFGSLLAEHWELPDQIRQSCASHDETAMKALNPTSPEDAFQRMVCLGYLTSRLSENRLDETHHEALANSIVEFIHWDRAQFDEMIVAITELRGEVEEFVGRLS